MNSDRAMPLRKKKVVPGLTIAKVGLWMTLAPVLIDYRTPDGTTWAVPFYTGILLISLAGTAILLARFGLTTWSRYRTVLAVATAFFLISTVSGLFWGNSLIVVLRTAPPLILYVSGMLAVGALMASTLDPRQLWPTVLVAAFTGMIIQVVVVQILVGIDLSTVRFQILTGAAPLVSAFIVTALFFGGWNLWRGVMTVMHLALVMASVTRTQIAVLLAAIVFFVAAARERALQVNRLGVLFLGLVGLSLTVVAVDSLMPVSQVGRWLDRFSVGETSHYGYDVTELTRIGEVRQQLTMLKESPTAMMFGYGAAQSTGMDQETKTILRALVGQETAEWVGQGIGHNSYIGVFFVGGLFGGGLLLMMQIWVLIRAFLLTRLLSSRLYRFHNRLILGAPIAYCAYMAYAALAATLGARSTAMLFAVTTGFTLWMYGQLENEIKRERLEARLRRSRQLQLAG